MEDIVLELGIIFSATFLGTGLALAADDYADAAHTVAPQQRVLFVGLAASLTSAAVMRIFSVLRK